MSDLTSDLRIIAEKSEQQISNMLEKIFLVGQPGGVYSTPVTVGDYTVITASEIMAGAGFGSGFGFGSSEETSQPTSGGGGGGGSGGSVGRPVAIISIGPDGVTVKPVVDVTKIALTGVTVLGTVVMLLRRMNKTNRRL